MKDIVIRQATKDDIDAIEKLEVECFSEPWSRDAIAHDICENNIAFYLVADAGGEVVGYMGIWKIVDEGHITNVAVTESYRRHHVASALFKVMFMTLEKDGIEKVTLEVRRSNAAAIALYEGLGFKEGGVRKGYYQESGEDAIIMWRLPKSAE